MGRFFYIHHRGPLPYEREQIKPDEVRRSSFVALCSALAPLCPRCGQKIQGQGAHPGAWTAGPVRCQNEIRYRGRSANCLQPVYLIAAADGMVNVVPLSQAEYTALQSDTRSPREVMKSLGVLCDAQEVAA